MDPKSGQSLNSNVVTIKSLANTIIPVKAASKIPTSSPLVRGNRTAYQRIQMAHSSLMVANSVLDMRWCRLPLVADKLTLRKPKKLKRLQFLCSDQQVITVSCPLMFRYTEELRTFREEDLPIRLPAIHSETLLRAISWMRQHKLEESEGGFCSTVIDSQWEEDLFAGSGNLCELMDLIMAAFHLGLNILARHASDYLQERLAAKTESEMELWVQISNRLASDEEMLHPLVD